MGQVGGLVVVEGETEFAFVGTQMISHEVGVLLKVDGLGGQGGQPLTTIPVGLGEGGLTPAPGFGAHTVLEIHDGQTGLDNSSF